MPQSVMHELKLNCAGDGSSRSWSTYLSRFFFAMTPRSKAINKLQAQARQIPDFAEQVSLLSDLEHVARSGEPQRGSILVVINLLEHAVGEAIISRLTNITSTVKQK